MFKEHPLVVRLLGFTASAGSSTLEDEGRRRMIGIVLCVPFVLCVLSACSTDPKPGGNDTDTDTGSDGDTVPGLAWVTIPGGTFLMGNSAEPNAQPEHEVTIAPFEMMQTEVTVAHYAACMEAAACTEPMISPEYECNWGEVDFEQHPVNCVDWHQASGFCEWIGGRLPTEAEWEYVACNGDAEEMYPWGDATATCTYAVMNDMSHEDGCDTGRTWAVCSKTTGNSDHGLCDIAGNVAEWVQDWWHSNYSNAPQDGSAWEDPTSSDRVFRGGSYIHVSYYLEADYRRREIPSGQYNILGFRCAREEQ